MRNAQLEAESVLTQQQDLREQEHVHLQCSVCGSKAVYNVARGRVHTHMCYTHSIEAKEVYRAAILPIEHVGSNQSRVWRF